MYTVEFKSLHEMLLHKYTFLCPRQAKIIFVFLTLAFCGYQVKSQTPTRASKDYVKGPTFDLKGEWLGKAIVQKLDLRNFLITSWKARKPTRFRVISYAREGYKSVCDMYIEEDQINNWQIVSDCSTQAFPIEASVTYERVYDTVKVVIQHLDAESAEKIDKVVVLSNSKSPNVEKLVF